jgi:hypothetical protein
VGPIEFWTILAAPRFWIAFVQFLHGRAGTKRRALVAFSLIGGIGHNICLYIAHTHHPLVTTAGCCCLEEWEKMAEPNVVVVNTHTKHDKGNRMQ